MLIIGKLLTTAGNHILAASDHVLAGYDRPTLMQHIGQNVGDRLWRAGLFLSGDYAALAELAG